MTRALALVEFDAATASATGFRLVDPEAPQLRVTELAATRGDGIFETARVRAGDVEEFDAHLERLAASARQLELPAPDVEVWRAAVDAVCAQLATAGVGEGSVTLVLSRGVDAGAVPTAWVLGAPAPDAVAVRRDGVRVVLLDRGYRHDVGATSPWLLAGAKTLSTAVHRAALREAHRRGADDAVFVSSDGFLLEGTTSSLLVLRGGTLVTPPLDSGVLAGTTQAALFRGAPALGLDAQYAPLTPADLATADAAWLVSSVRGVAPIRELDGAAFPVDAALSARLNGLLGHDLPGE